MCETGRPAVFAERADKKQIEAGAEFAPKFDEGGLIPAIAQDHVTGDVLMVAYMNAEALAETLATGRAVYFSRSRGKLWRKGEESGNVQVVHQILTDCDQDVIVVKVEQIGGAACHTGFSSCFYRAIDLEAAAASADAPAPLVPVLTDRVFDPAQVYGKK